MIVAGLMSGTSVDGVDISLVEITGKGHRLNTRLLGHKGYPYSPSLRQRILQAAECGSVGEVCHLHALLGEVFASAIIKTARICRIPLKKIALIGSHGQTVYHCPRPVKEPGVGMVRSTFQIGDPNIIAERTGVTTVSDFRSRDMAAGGEGAPLAPYGHAIVFNRKKINRLILNLGGIANVTVLPGNGEWSQIRAFDTGPCNMLLDGLISIESQGRRRMDRGGRQASRGSVNEKLLGWLSGHSYLSQHPPKSTGRELFGASYIQQVLKQGRRQKLPFVDILATSCRFIARVIGDAQQWIPQPIQEVVAGGGGVRNTRLMAELEARFSPVSLKTMEACGSHSTAFEAQAFAILAYQHIHGVSANLPSVTGARHPVILGTVSPGKMKECDT
ncbi:MAG: anhydro-N-acetylmuramic acid kinase [Nitrospirales bacterium]